MIEKEGRQALGLSTFLAAEAKYINLLSSSCCSSSLGLRSLFGFGRFLDVHLGGRHTVLDGHLGSHLEVSRYIGVGAESDLPTVTAFLYCHHVTGDLQDRPGHLVGLDRAGEGR